MVYTLCNWTHKILQKWETEKGETNMEIKKIEWGL